MTASGADQPDVEIRFLHSDEFDQLEPLWLVVHRAQVTLTRHLESVLPAAGEEVSWRRRRALYRRTLGRGLGLLLRPFNRLRGVAPGFILVAAAGSRVVGYIAVRVERRESATWNRARWVGSITSVSVGDDFQGRGIGRRLLLHAGSELQARGVNELTGEVVVGNKDALRLYERLGFHPFFVNVVARIPLNEETTDERS